MTLKAWSSTLLILCFSFAAWAQKGNSYLEKPLPQGWGTGTAHTIPETIICSAAKYNR